MISRSIVGSLMAIAMLLLQTGPFAETVPGGIAELAIISIEKPVAVYDGRKVMVLPHNNQWQAIVGIDLNAEPGEHELVIITDHGQETLVFEVKDKEYEAQYITIKDKRKVNPGALDMERINRDTEAIKGARATWSNIELPDVRLQLPVKGRISSPFGLRRFFNQQARKPHSGLDIAAPLGTPIHAAAHGEVIVTGDYFFNGKTVFIDHGQGLITMYCHMNSIDVEPGQSVSKKDSIGTVGKTGRVTGAHLHWSVMLNQVMVNPLLLVVSPEP